MRLLAKDIVSKEGDKVELIGWVGARRDHGKIIFIDLRDRSGVAQLVFVPGKNQGSPSTSSGNKIYELAATLRSEWVIKVEGIVAKRPKGMENDKIPTGLHEVQVSHLEIISEAETPPIALDTDGLEIGEESRMKYRYLDLRRDRLAKNIRMRHKIIQFMREFLTARDFVEIETPILGKSTPEGARDYIVPARLHHGKFYALPQSPQQYKQLLMVSGFERYFQIARCFRDEDTRGDRQPEFTQLDLEMSFVTADEVMDLAEELFTALVEKLYPNCHITQTPFPRLNFHEVMKQYGTDKPDLRDNPSTGSGQADPNELAFAFVVNFPMFEWKETEKRWDAVHHPFTMPQVKNVKEFREMFSAKGGSASGGKKDPSKILAFQYDLVLNGYEVGGGSIRIHDPELLAAVFEVMGNKREDIEVKFGHMLQAFKFGVPPHGGIASGLDRVVAILQNEPNIREVIAFPKTGDGSDLMMGAPSSVESSQLKELGIEVAKTKKDE